MRKAIQSRALGRFRILVAALALAGAAQAADRVHSMVANGAVQVEVISEGQGPLVVMLPSAGRGVEDYDEVAALLAAQGFRVLRPEPRSCGRTTGPHEGISLKDVADDVAAVIRNETAGPAVLIGHAAGSFVARMAAVEHPELVRAIVLAGAGARRYPVELNGIVQKVGLPGLPDAERSALLRQAFFAPGNDVSPWLGGWCPLMRFGGTGGAPAVSERERWWGGGDKAVLEIQGLDDPFKPPATWGEYKAEYGERVNVVQVARASHALFPEQPGAVAAALIQWLKSLKQDQP
jgi:pimeloyl-ACP methyl ester carboxylesterase